MKNRTLAYAAAFTLLLLLIPQKSRVPRAETPEEIMAQERSTESLSAYDKVIKATADSLGMDWHLIAAVVYHAGSATSGSAHNAFKVKLASRNSVYLIWKNMPERASLRTVCWGLAVPSRTIPAMTAGT